MTVESNCSGCGSRLRVDDVYAGKQAVCPRCGTSYVVPAADTSARPESVLASDQHREADNAAVHADWLLKTPDGKTYGPVSKPNLDQWVAEGRVDHHCQISGGGADTWQAADQLYPQLAPPVAGGSPFAATWSASQLTASSRAIVEPHRGVLILVLGLVGFLVGCPLFSLMAWVMGNGDLAKMHRGQMDKEGLGLTNAGRVLGMILTIIWMIGGALALFIALMAIGLHLA